VRKRCTAEPIFGEPCENRAENTAKISTSNVSGWSECPAGCLLPAALNLSRSGKDCRICTKGTLAKEAVKNCAGVE
jgi:hypothetical protein